MGIGSRDLAAGLLLLALCVVVAGSGSVLRFEPTDDARSSTEERTDRTTDDEAPGPESRESPRDRGDGGSDRGGSIPFRAFALLVLAAAAAVLVALLSRLRLSLRRRRGDPPVRATALPTGAPLPEEDAEADDLAEALDAGLADLAGGSARNAIVAAWLRLEAACVSERFTPDRADTPSEFVGRALASYDLDPGAIADLADLYREARFSRHPVTEGQRRAAAQALRTLLDGIHTAAGARR